MVSLTRHKKEPDDQLRAGGEVLTPSASYRIDGQSYDDRQIGAVLIVRPCCTRPVYATNPLGKCAGCR